MKLNGTDLTAATGQDVIVIGSRLSATKLRLDKVLPVRRAGLASLQGDATTASHRWRHAAEAFSRLQLLPCAAAARFRLGQALRGEAGDRLSEEALEQIRERGVRNPARYAAALAPAKPNPPA